MTTRREFLTRVGQTGGFGAAFTSMHALGLMAELAESAVDLAPNAGNGIKVAILGGGNDGPYKEFIQPDDRFYFAGDHCARIGAWQEGAALAAHRAAQMIGDRVRMMRLSTARIGQAW